MIPAPILYAVNTRCWLRELSEREGHPITLENIPEIEIRRWQAFGFTHIWLLGVWQVGPGARAVALDHWHKHWHSEIPSTEANVHGSPFAIRDYSVDTRLGEPISLMLLKERFANAGMSLILDFVGNHLGLDTPEPLRYPARFVQTQSAVPGTFELDTKFGKRHFAHGRDPYFPPWNDTIQLDYRVAETHEHMATIAQTISMFGNGLRCDMAMLLLPDVFETTWKEFPSRGAHQTAANFWKMAIPQIRQLQPRVDLIAEAYWDREAELQSLGFDYTYNKRVYDFIVRGQVKELGAFLRQCPPLFLDRSVHFLENHDEARAAATLETELHKAAALLLLSLPGMAMLHDGQLEGRKSFARIQMDVRAPEEDDPELSLFYPELLVFLSSSWLRKGQAALLSSTQFDTIAIAWAHSPKEQDITIINLGASDEQWEWSFPTQKAQVQQLYTTRTFCGSVTFANDCLKVQMPARFGIVIRLTNE